MVDSTDDSSRNKASIALSRHAVMLINSDSNVALLHCNKSPWV